MVNDTLLRLDKRVTLERKRSGLQERSRRSGGSMRPPGYDAYIHSDAWKNGKRPERLAIDGNQCQGCGFTEKLNVHHRTYERLGDEPMGDLVTVCKSCHYLVHQIHRELLAEITDRVLDLIQQFELDSSQEQVVVNFGKEKHVMTTGPMGYNDEYNDIFNWLCEHPGPFVLLDMIKDGMGGDDQSAWRKRVSKWFKMIQTEHPGLLYHPYNSSIYVSRPEVQQQLVSSETMVSKPTGFVQNNPVSQESFWFEDNEKNELQSLRNEVQKLRSQVSMGLDLEPAQEFKPLRHYHTGNGKSWREWVNDKGEILEAYWKNQSLNKIAGCSQCDP